MADKWQQRAACKDAGPELFFGPAREHGADRSTREAAAWDQFCSGCPVRAECREAAIDGREFGVWAGENEEQRERAIRQRRKAAS